MAEDDYVIGMVIAEELEEAGFQAIGPVSTAEGALALLVKHDCHAAILDRQLRNETSERVAESLSASRTPFILYSGQAAPFSSQDRQAFRSLSKPAPTGALAAVVAEAIAAHRSSDT